MSGTWIAIILFIVVLCDVFSNFDIRVKFEMTLSTFAVEDSSNDLITLLKALCIPNSMHSSTTV